MTREQNIYFFSSLPVCYILNNRAVKQIDNHPFYLAGWTDMPEVWLTGLCAPIKSFLPLCGMGFDLSTWVSLRYKHTVKLILTALHILHSIPYDLICSIAVLLQILFSGLSSTCQVQSNPVKGIFKWTLSKELIGVFVVGNCCFKTF